VQSLFLREDAGADIRCEKVRNWTIELLKITEFFTIEED
jgi:hypothetical protein